VIGDWVPITNVEDVQNVNFHLEIDGQTVQKGWSGDMLFSVDTLIEYVSKFMTLKIGDLLFTGTPVGVGPVSIGQHLIGYLEEQKVLDFNVR
jgi:2-keto-4-pentenoate hydratase/2-oxohepta-3-ene-1,7-dioic acid hydratase in catechol pathway